jgi:hypothetical protein
MKARLLQPSLFGHFFGAVLVVWVTSVAFAANPIPSIVGPVRPQAVVPGSGDFTLTVYGANFVQGAVVNWNRQPRHTTFISARELHALVLASDVEQPTAGFVTVTNPAPGGGVSSSSHGLVEVHVPTTTMVLNRPHVYIGGYSTLIADFNNDGKPDLAGGYGEEEIPVWLGEGDGTFQRGSIATQNYFSSGGIAYGDFNGDGNADLVFQAGPFGPPTQLQVNLGDGNGKFHLGSRFGNFVAGGSFSEISVGDFNRDGKLDIAAGEDPSPSVFLGNGDGTFQPRKRYQPRGASVPITGDFNGDGKLDLVAILSHQLYLLLGNGDGTFQKPIKLSASIESCGFGPTLFVDDFNGDGNLDLAFCDKARIGILLGRGDGTFEEPVFYATGSVFYTVGVGDFNSDGKTDLLVSRQVNQRGQLLLFLGNGDGTFQGGRLIKLPENYYGETGVLATDFDSDGLLDFALQLPSGVSAAVYTQK